jgi:phosphoribosylanthranilate isomerase
MVAAVVKRTRVKICGITRPEDAIAAVAAGVDAIGLNFYAPSPRAITLEQAVAICAQLPPFVTVVALTVNAPRAQIEQILNALPACVLQFHGDETASQCESFARPYIKAVRMRDGIDVLGELERFASAQALLLDTYQPNVPGGTGEIFDWHKIPSGVGQRIILAGGLNPGNIEEAVRVTAPYAVDVSGGVELAPGLKDVTKINEFIGNVIRADACLVE